MPSTTRKRTGAALGGGAHPIALERGHPPRSASPDRRTRISRKTLQSHARELVSAAARRLSQRLGYRPHAPASWSEVFGPEARPVQGGAAGISRRGEPRCRAQDYAGSKLRPDACSLGRARAARRHRSQYLSLPVEEPSSVCSFRELRRRRCAFLLHRPLFSKDKPLHRHRGVSIALLPPPCIYVNAASGIREPRDLVGKKVGNPIPDDGPRPGYAAHPLDEYGVPVQSVTYYIRRREEPGRPEKIKAGPPAAEIRPVQRIGEQQTLSRCWPAVGDRRAVYRPRTPSSYRHRREQVKACSRTTPTWSAITTAGEDLLPSCTRG